MDVLAVMGLIAVWCASNIAGWLMTRQEHQPFSWLIFLGPWLYVRRHPWRF